MRFLQKTIKFLAGTSENMIQMSVTHCKANTDRAGQKDEMNIQNWFGFFWFYSIEWQHDNMSWLSFSSVAIYQNVCDFY